MKHSLFFDLLSTAGPSGSEARPAAIWREAASEFADVQSDVMGNSIAQIGTGKPIALMGHIDEIGLVINYIAKDGFLHVQGVGGWDPQNLVGQRVTILTKDGEVEGVIGRKPIHLLSTAERGRVVQLTDLTVDIGVSDREEAEALVTVGDVAVITADPLQLQNGRVASRSMDNRIGSYVALKALKRARKRLNVPAAAVVSVQEEIGCYGARTSAVSFGYEAAVVIDVTHATDVPGVSEQKLGSHPLGSGPVITKGPLLHPAVVNGLIETAEEEEIPYSLSVASRTTSTDADAVSLSQAGVPTALVSVPLRYMHSSIETCDMADVENTIRLLSAFLRKQQPGTVYTR
jgi:putative aminopeptidase FrvX